MIKYRNEAHIINVESDELASGDIVGSGDAHQFAHQIECFSNRKGVSQKLNVTDNWPSNQFLFKQLFSTDIVLRLGLFHVIQRITSTLNKELVDFLLAVKALSSAIYYEEPKDVEKVEMALRAAGNIGGGKPISNDDIERKKKLPQNGKPGEKYPCLDVWGRNNCRKSQGMENTSPQTSHPQSATAAPTSRTHSAAAALAAARRSRR